MGFGEQRKIILPIAMRWHRRLAWLGGLTLLLWGLSGALHPLMSWFGPQQQQAFPPALNLSAIEDLQLPPLAGQPLRVLKLVAGEREPLWQLTLDEQAPRLYFTLGGSELPAQDQAQARWLAAWYTGRAAGDIEHIELQTSFDADYPAVNRLLPVWRVHFAGDDALIAWVYTETGALAALNNGWKTTAQAVFRQLHSWSWLDHFDHARVILMALLMLSLAAMAVSGVAMVLWLRRRSGMPAVRRWHRGASYLLWIFVLAWSASGFYHLLQMHLLPPIGGVRLGEAIAVDDLRASDQLLGEIKSAAGGKSVNALAVVDTDQGLAVRLSLGAGAASVAMGEHDHHSDRASREARFAGNPAERTAVYLRADNAELLPLADEFQARRLALQAMDLADGDIEATELITGFVPGYDFRNKRLPVWRVRFTDDAATELFVDPASGVLVDRQRSVDRAESLSFTLLHKWNMLVPLMGRYARDVLVVASIAALSVFAVLGLVMRVRSQRKLG